MVRVRLYGWLEGRWAFMGWTVLAFLKWASPGGGNACPRGPRLIWNCGMGGMVGSRLDAVLEEFVVRLVWLLV